MSSTPSAVGSQQKSFRNTTATGKIVQSAVVDATRAMPDHAGFLLILMHVNTIKLQVVQLTAVLLQPPLHGFSHGDANIVQATSPKGSDAHIRLHEQL